MCCIAVIPCVQSHSHVLVVGLGERKGSSDDHLEDIDTRRQNVRCAAAGMCVGVVYVACVRV